MKSFKDVEPGLFQTQVGIIYCKFEAPAGDYNAVMLTSGKLAKFNDDDRVYVFVK